MPRRTPKKYKVTVSYCEHTPEEAERLREQIRETLYKAKLIAMKIQVDEKQKISDKKLRLYEIRNII